MVVNLTINYKQAGVDIDAGNEAVCRIGEHVRSTFNTLVRGDLGSFGGLFAFPSWKYEKPILVASTDGVGTKLKIAVAMKKHDTIGRDLVAHCINDILVQGAIPLFFLDYIGIGKMEPLVIEELVKGIATGCREGGCVLIGGETAEMPGIYKAGEYDLAGTIIGVVEEEKILPKTSIKPGDSVFGLPSAGLHTNGYSLARKVCFDVLKATVDTYRPELGRTIGEELLAEHRCYLPVLKEAVHQGLIKGLAHITGGGLIENIPRILPESCTVIINKGSWPGLPIFTLLQEAGQIPENDMFRTFNMGIGMVCIIAQEDETIFSSLLETQGVDFFKIGEIVSGQRSVSLV